MSIANRSWSSRRNDPLDCEEDGALATNGAKGVAAEGPCDLEPGVSSAIAGHSDD